MLFSQSSISNDVLLHFFPTYIIHTAFKWVGAKIAQCVTCNRRDKKGEGVGGQPAYTERKRQMEEDLAYREVETYGYEQYG